MKIAILGYGNFGSGFGTYLSRLNHEIIKEEVKDAELVFVSVPSFAVVSALLKFKNELTDKKIIICSKGFTPEGRLISDELKENSIENVFFLYGPTLVEEIIKGEIFGMVLAGGEGKEDIKKQIESDQLHIELSEDIIGLQVGSALKNVMTIFIGMVEGAGYGKNTKALIFTKCLKEIQNFGVALGANKDTFYGLSCLGDLTLDSRNRYLGVEFIKGRKIEDLIKEKNCTFEGIRNIKNAILMAQRLNINIPIINNLNSVLSESLPIKEAIKNII